MWFGNWCRAVLHLGLILCSLRCISFFICNIFCYLLQIVSVISTLCPCIYNIIFPSNIICSLKLETWIAFCPGSRVWTNDDVGNTNKLKQTKRKGKALRNKQTIGLQIQAKKEEKKKKTNIGNDKRKEKEKDRGRNKRPRSPLPMLSSLKNITNDEVTNTKKTTKQIQAKRKKRKRKRKTSREKQMTWIAFALASRAASASAAIARCNLVSNKYSQDIRINIFKQIFPRYSYW